MKKKLVDMVKQFMSKMKNATPAEVEAGFSAFQEWTQSTLKEVDAANIRAILDPLAEVLKQNEDGANDATKKGKNETIIATAKEAYKSVNVYIVSHESKGIAFSITGTIKVGFITGIITLLLNYYLMPV